MGSLIEGETMRGICWRRGCLAGWCETVRAVVVRTALEDSRWSAMVVGGGRDRRWIMDGDMEVEIMR